MAMADLRGAWGTPHPRPNSFNFMQFLGKFGKIVCCTPPEGWRPNLWEILDLPLHGYCYRSLSLYRSRSLLVWTHLNSQEFVPPRRSLFSSKTVVDTYAICRWFSSWDPSLRPRNTPGKDIACSHRRCSCTRLPSQSATDHFHKIWNSQQQQLDWVIYPRF